jgi:hypothetical protein
VVVNGRGHALYFPSGSCRMFLPMFPKGNWRIGRFGCIWGLCLSARCAGPLCADPAFAAGSVGGAGTIALSGRGAPVRVVTFEPQGPMVELNNPGMLPLLNPYWPSAESTRRAGGLGYLNGSYCIGA